MKAILFTALLTVNVSASEQYSKTIFKELMSQRQPLTIVDSATFKTRSMVNIVNSVIRIESNFDANAIVDEKNVRDKSYGLMQIRCKTAKAFGLKVACSKLTKPSLNIRFGIKYLMFQMKRYKFDVSSAISAYNAGRAKKKCIRTSCSYANNKYVKRFHIASSRQDTFSNTSTFPSIAEIIDIEVI